MIRESTSASDRFHKNYVVGTSPIHRKGLFAARRIDKDTLIGIYDGPRTDENGPHVLWVEDEDVEYGIDGRNDLRYVNHSPAPNAVFEGEELRALQAIGPGEEITFFYGDEWQAAYEDELQEAV